MLGCALGGQELNLQRGDWSSKQPPAGHVAASAGVLTDSSGEVIDRWSLLQMDCVLLEDDDDGDDW